MKHFGRLVYAVHQNYSQQVGKDELPGRTILVLVLDLGVRVSSFWVLPQSSMINVALSHLGLLNKLAGEIGRGCKIATVLFSVGTSALLNFDK
jgi:hypothetical protein